MKNKSKVDDDYLTPRKLYDKLDAEFHFDFDPCPYHADFDGLSVEWGMRNFVNPPYSRQLKEAFFHKAIEELDKGKTSVFLVPVSTSSKLFAEAIVKRATEIRFVHKRIRFCKPDVAVLHTAAHDSMIIVFSPSHTHKTEYSIFRQD